MPDPSGDGASGPLVSLSRPLPPGQLVVVEVVPASEVDPGPELPLFLQHVPAGFPSPADDYVEGRLDLLDLTNARAPSCYFVRAAGESMVGAGIQDGDVLVVDRALDPASGDVVVAAVDGELTVKRFVRRGARVSLLAANPEPAHRPPGGPGARRLGRRDLLVPGPPLQARDEAPGRVVWHPAQRSTPPPMTRATAPSDLPRVPAVYALYGGRDVAYVGMTKDLRGRVEQHLVRRDSSVTTGASVVSLDPDLVTGGRWWTRDDFGDRTRLEAAELVAFDELRPVLRSRGRGTEGARALAASDPFRSEAEALFGGRRRGPWRCRR